MSGVVIDFVLLAYGTPRYEALTNEERPGHQKSLSSRALVQKRPTCPVVGES